jgi:hypothetical protein
MTKIVTLLSVLAVCAVARSLPAQGVAPHKGFHASVGLGSGGATPVCDDGCNKDSQQGGTILLRFGGAVSPRVVLSGEVGGWRRDKNEGLGNGSWVMAVAQFYPNVASGFFLKTGLGIGGTSTLVLVPGGGARTMRTSGGSFALGVGYDIAVRGGFGITPYFDLHILPQTETTGVVGSQRGMNVAQLGVAASWR